MDSYLLRVFQEQVVYSCKAVLLGLEDIHAGLRDPGGSDRLWYGVQNFIVASGNLSKALWGTGRTAEEAKRRYKERQPLRDSLAVTDDSPMRRIKIRNDLEHIDERIEEWWNRSKHHNRVGLIIGPRETISGDAIGGTDVLRWIDPTTGDVIFWGNELNINAVVQEVQRILEIAEAEAPSPP